MPDTDRKTLPELIAQCVRAWPQWSRAERRNMDGVIGDVIDHMSEGTGTGFVADWCERVLMPFLRAHGRI